MQWYKARTYHVQVFNNVIMVMLVLRVWVVKILSLQLSQREVDLTPVQIPVTIVGDTKVSLLSFSHIRVMITAQEVVGVSVCAAVDDMRRALI